MEIVNPYILPNVNMIAIANNPSAIVQDNRFQLGDAFPRGRDILWTGGINVATNTKVFGREELGPKQWKVVYEVPAEFGKKGIINGFHVWDTEAT